VPPELPEASFHNEASDPEPPVAGAASAAPDAGLDPLEHAIVDEAAATIARNTNPAPIAGSARPPVLPICPPSQGMTS